MSSANNNQSNNPRRDFLKTGGLGVFAAYLGTRLFGASTARAADAAKPGDTKLEMVKPTDPMAQALGYSEDAKKADTKKFPKRAAPGGDKQFCYDCQFFQVKVGNPKDVQAAACTIFGNKGVKSHGWCNSWTQNPNVKA